MPAPRFTVEDTPNPHALKFTADRVLNPGSPRSYRSAADTAGDPLAAALFAAGPVVSVLIVGNFVTVNKKPSARWKTLQPEIEAVLKDQFDPSSPPV
ncbi:MAG: NifU N-terminal domain-containing protein [Planctomycetota bacterium]